MYDPLFDGLFANYPALKAKLKAGADELDVLEEYLQAQRDRYPGDSGPVHFGALVILLRKIREVQEPKRRGRRKAGDEDPSDA